ncbi:hypothetical protein AOQ88_01910 [Candidatus Riesia sp. GBBU]|nr:hypothetical protein AOQ88_01910 [Candidatus Riesia sp. GBBU]
MNEQKNFSYIKKVVLGVEYNGKNYHGWQNQPNVRSVQHNVEFALSKIANENIRTFCGGRTDSGVHAIEQVIHFETKSNRSDVSWVYGTNHYLPIDISVKWSRIVDKSFHARFSAVSRTYRYFILNDLVNSAIISENVCYQRKFLDENKMNKASRVLIGEKDFSSFRSSKCQSKSSVKKIRKVQVFRRENYVIIEITANSFLYNMVRNIVGNLIEIGLKKKKINWIEELLYLKDRKKSLKKAESKGLYLMYIEYPQMYNLPVEHKWPLFLPR